MKGLILIPIYTCQYAIRGKTLTLEPLTGQLMGNTLHGSIYIPLSFDRRKRDMYRTVNFFEGGCDWNKRYFKGPQ